MASRNNSSSIFSMSSGCIKTRSCKNYSLILNLDHKRTLSNMLGTTKGKWSCSKAKPHFRKRLILAVQPHSQHRKQPVSVNRLGKVVIRSRGDALLQITLHGSGGQRQHGQVLEF